MHKSPQRILNRNKFIYYVVALCVVIYVLFQIGKSFSQSLFTNKKDRINLVVYGPYSAIYSLGLRDKQDYIIPFSDDIRLTVPSGYGKYRVGSLGKLIKLDKKPDLYKKIFSLAAGTFVDYYFYENKDIVYYNLPLPQTDDIKLNGNKILFLESNASFFDKLYLMILVGQREREKFKVINDVLHGEQEEFVENNLGLFYQRTFRNENKTVQIMYKTNYTVAESLSSILEGSGIRVSDIDNNERMGKKCQVKEEKSTFSITAKAISNFFNCDIIQDKVGVYDIIFELGDLESSWEI